MLNVDERDVPEPRALESHKRMRCFVEELSGCGYDVAGCAARLGESTDVR